MNISCEGRTKHRTVYAARKSFLKKKFKNRKAKLNIYKCSSCGFYHVGNSLGKKVKL